MNERAMRMAVIADQAWAGMAECEGDFEGINDKLLADEPLTLRERQIAAMAICVVGMKICQGRMIAIRETE